VRVSLDHVHLFATDVAATLDFFCSMLGAKLIWDEEAAGVRNVRLALGHAFIHVYEQAPKTQRGGPVHHLGVETDDLDGLVARMKQLGYVFRNEVREQPQFRYVMIAAPDDLLIELFECREPQRWQLKT
jgi:catechol 2,3-dioxygenase-like lactoylglutathione lyase family enzyme